MLLTPGSHCGLPAKDSQVGAAVGSVCGSIHFRCGARATRKPRLLLRFVGWFLLRFDDWQFLALLFQLPPRLTRFEPSDR